MQTAPIGTLTLPQRLCCAGVLVILQRPPDYTERRSADGYAEPLTLYLVATAHVSARSALDVDRVVKGGWWGIFLHLKVAAMSGPCMCMRLYAPGSAFLHLVMMTYMPPYYYHIRHLPATFGCRCGAPGGGGGAMSVKGCTPAGARGGGGR